MAFKNFSYSNLPNKHEELVRLFSLSEIERHIFFYLPYNIEQIILT